MLKHFRFEARQHGRDKGVKNSQVYSSDQWICGKRKSAKRKMSQLDGDGIEATFTLRWYFLTTFINALKQNAFTQSHLQKRFQRLHKAGQGGFFKHIHPGERLRKCAVLVCEVKCCIIWERFVRKEQNFLLKELITS